ncbi:BamA/TamA family outer membrane protein, partial [Nonlabens mediterrranea]|nr:BamA/TamA family outer membrane protein [Nonlabens mediterrranea]
GITSGLNLLRRDSTYQNTSINAGLFYSITPKSSLGLSYNNKQSTTNQSDDSINDYESNNAIFNFKHLTPSIEEIYIIDFLTDLQIGIGNRTTTTESNNQILIEATILKNLHIDNKQSIHLENRNKYLGSKNILFNELYQIGGINSIRGFNQNSIDTSLFSTINTEYRYLLNKQIYLHSILDYAIFEDYTTKKVRNIYAIGFGAAILTQSGILRLSVANGTFSGANIDFSSTVAHINLLINF